MSTAIHWDDHRVFLAALEEGSLSGAARRLGLSHPTVRARIEALEHQLGTVLFTRSVNGLTPTPLARSLSEPARAMAMAAELFLRQASPTSNEISGTVRLSVPEFMGVEVLPEMLARLRLALPALRIELVLSDAPADLLIQEVDIAVRTVAPKQEALVARKVAAIPLGLFAAPSYIARRGAPKALADLADHDFLGPDRNLRDLAVATNIGVADLASRLVIRSDNHAAQLALARAGVGIAVTQVPVGRRDPLLVHLLPEVEAYRLDTWVVTHENLARLPRIRAIMDHLAREFREMVAGRGMPKNGD